MNQNFDPQQNYDDQQYQNVQQSYVPQQGYGYQQSPPYLYGNHYKTPLREPGTKRDMIFAGVFFLLSILCVNFTLYGGQGIALAIGAMGIYGAGLVYLLPRNRGNRAYLGFCILTYMLCCFSLLLTDSTFGKLLILDAMVLLAGITVMEMMSLRREPKGTFGSILDWVRTTIALPLESIGAVCFALWNKKNVEGKAERRKLGSVLLGMICAVPVLLIVIPLLMGADQAFEGLLDRITYENSGEFLTSLIFGTVLFFLIFGQHFGAMFQKEEQSFKKDGRNGIDTTILTTFLVAISLVYVMYLISQLAYFFSAFGGLLPEEYTAAQYARRGFFEMVAVCIINLGILLFGLWGARKKNGKEPKIIRGLSLFLCVFSLILIATAMSKMVLYIHSFGMTYLRLITSVFMVFLCVVFVTMGLWIFVRKLPYMKVFVIAAVILTLAVGFADPARVVAGYNVNAYLSGKLDTVDMSELRLLDSHGIVPFLWKLTEDSNSQVYETAWELLHDHGLDFGFFQEDGEQYSYDWRGFNLSSYKAYALIKEHRKEIYDNARAYGVETEQLYPIGAETGN